MRIGTFAAGLVVGFGVLLTGTARAQAPASNAEPPTLDALQRAVDTLPPGRVERPASYGSMTTEQQQYLQSVLAGPRSAVSGPLVVMLAAPKLGDLAQRTMAYARFAGTEGFSSVPVKLNELAILDGRADVVIAVRLGSARSLLRSRGVASCARRGRANGHGAACGLGARRQGGVHVSRRVPENEASFGRDVRGGTHGTRR